MGNSPPAYFGVKCPCGRDLPPCQCWSEIKQGEIDREIDSVYAYTFLEGKYYRIRGSPVYLCPKCFWKPRDNYRQSLGGHKEKDQRKKEMDERVAEMKRTVDKRRQDNQRRAKDVRLRGEQIWIEEKRRREEERQRESSEAQSIVKKFDEQQKKEEQRKSELETRQQEVKEEKEKQEALLEEQRRRSEKRREKRFLAERRREQKEREAQLKIEHQQNNLSQQFTSWTRKNQGRNVRQTVQMEVYHPFCYSSVPWSTSSDDSDFLGDPNIISDKESESYFEGSSKSASEDEESDAEVRSSSEEFSDENFSDENFSSEDESFTEDKDDKELKSNDYAKRNKQESFLYESDLQMPTETYHFDKIQWSDHDFYDIPSDISLDIGEEFAKVTEFVQEVISIIFEMQPTDDYLDMDWLESVQIQMLSYYTLTHSLSFMQKETLSYNFSNIQSNLNTKECLFLTKAMCMLNSCDPLEFDVMPTTLTTDPIGEFLSRLIHSGFLLDYSNTVCMERCLKALVSITIDNIQLQECITQTSSWSTYDRFTFLQICNLKCIPYEHQAEILHIVQVYNIPPQIVSTFGQSTNPLAALKVFVREEHEKDLETIMQEIKATSLIEQGTLDIVETIMSLVDHKLSSVITFDYKRYLTSTAIQKTKSALKSCAVEGAFDVNKISDAIVTLACAVKDKKPFCPRITQLTALTILIVSHTKSINRLLEVLTGEGKSCVIAMFAVVLSIQGKDVDIITSSPILAVRDADEWKDYYQTFELKVADNSSIEWDASPFDIDESRRCCYRKQIVYGTISNFAADVLREEFEQKQIRCGRNFDVVIADEVDLLMLDEGIQLTYLSHDASLLHHIEPVLAAVWSIIGQYNPAPTVDGDSLYVGRPKLLIDAIFDSIDSSILAHLLRDSPDATIDSSLILNIALETGLINDSVLAEIKQADSMEAKLQALKLVEPEELLRNLEDYMPYKFQLHTLEGGVLASTTSDELEESGHVQQRETVKILDLQNGTACTLNSRQQLCDWAKAKIESKLHFTDTSYKQDDKDADYLQLPLSPFFQDFVTNQLHVYIESALQCLHMVEDREYSIKDGKIIPVDFLNSGVMETNKKWGGGLQQMLEMKHRVRVSPMSVVTNFMSHIELFSRYKHGGSIFGLTGTLGLDSPATRTVLHDLFDVNVCSIPTHRRRKLFERPEVIVHGDTQKWFDEIIEVIEIAIKPVLPYRYGRSVLVLCEDIKTAHEFRNYILENKIWNEHKVKMYVHSNSDEVKMVINQTFTPGEIVIATNLAGRGTDIKVTEEVNRSGGLLCLLTFLPRNRRVELQAFGRTARKGEPGSVQCILKSSSLPAHYHDLSLEDIRNLRDQEEQFRLDQLIQSDIQEVQLREVLFKTHCKFLGKIHEQIKNRDDQLIVIDSLNESWGQWLQMKKDEIENLDQANLVEELETLHDHWQPICPNNPSEFIDVPVANFYHMIKFGNTLLASQEKENAKRAASYYAMSIKMMPRYSLIAHYYHAYCTIMLGKGDYINEAISDLTEAEKCLDFYVKEVTTVLQCVTITSQLRQPASEHQDKPEEEPSAFLKELGDESKDDDFSLQMQVRMQILDNIKRNIQEALQKLEMYKKKGDDVQVKVLGVFSLLPDADYMTNKELCALWNLGMEVVYSVEKKPRFCWEGLVVCLLGVAEIFGGLLLTVFTVGTAASIGMTLISEGISDIIEGVVAMCKGEFSWAEWGISKATSLAISLVTGGLASFASKGTKSLRIGAKLTKLGKELKAIPQVAKASWGLALKENIKNAAKYVVKEVAQQAIMRGISHAEDKAFEGIAVKIGEKCGEKVRGELQSSFANGQLRCIINDKFLSKLPKSSLPSDPLYRQVEKEAFDFFSLVGDHTVSRLVTHSEIRERLTSASLSFLSEMSKKHKSKQWYYVAVEVGVMADCVTRTVEDLQILINAFIPEMVKVCNESLAMSNHHSLGDSRGDDQRCACTLKESLSNHLSNVFNKAVAALIQQKLGYVVSHGLNRTINHVGKNFLNKIKFLENKKVLEELQAGQRANYIRSVDIFSSEPSQHDRDMVHSYIKNVADSDHPGSLLELRAVVEHFGQGVTIYQEVNGKMKKHCSIDPTSNSRRKGTPNIQLVFTPPPNKKSKLPGHYEVLVNGKKRSINSRTNSCLFEAFSCGMHPKSTIEEQQRYARELRAQVVTRISKEPQLWLKHISHRVKMEQLSKGNYYALVGAGPAKKRNIMSKILPHTYKEMIDPDAENTLITTYKQANGIICEAKRVYDQPITLERDEKGEYISNKDLKLLHISVEMKGLNIKKNKGMRCWDTQPVSGMIKRHLKRVKKGNRNKESEVSFHLCPSEAGACAGNTYANAVMASPHYNKLERDIWTPEVRSYIGNEDFCMHIEANVGSIVPKDIEQFITNANKDRCAQGREQIHATNTGSLLQRLKMIEEIDPRAFRVKNLTGTIFREGKDHSMNFSMPEDFDLFVPNKYSKPDQPKQYGNELSKAEKKINQQRFNCPPKYRSPPRLLTKKKIAKYK